MSCHLQKFLDSWAASRRGRRQSTMDYWTPLLSGVNTPCLDFPSGGGSGHCIGSMWEFTWTTGWTVLRPMRLWTRWARADSTVHGGSSQQKVPFPSGRWSWIYSERRMLHRPWSIMGNDSPSMMHRSTFSRRQLPSRCTTEHQRISFLPVARSRCSSSPSCWEMHSRGRGCRGWGDSSFHWSSILLCLFSLSLILQTLQLWFRGHKMNHMPVLQIWYCTYIAICHLPYISMIHTVNLFMFLSTVNT